MYTLRPLFVAQDRLFASLRATKSLIAPAIAEHLFGFVPACAIAGVHVISLYNSNCINTRSIIQGSCHCKGLQGSGPYKTDEGVCGVTGLTSVEAVAGSDKGLQG